MLLREPKHEPLPLLGRILGEPLGELQRPREAFGVVGREEAGLGFSHWERYDQEGEGEEGEGWRGEVEEVAGIEVVDSEAAIEDGRDWGRGRWEGRVREGVGGEGWVER